MKNRRNWPPEAEKTYFYQDECISLHFSKSGRSQKREKQKRKSFNYFILFFITCLALTWAKLFTFIHWFREKHDKIYLNFITSTSGSIFHQNEMHERITERHRKHNFLKYRCDNITVAVSVFPSTCFAPATLKVFPLFTKTRDQFPKGARRSDIV